MGRVELLVSRYEGFARDSWVTGLSGHERVWFAVYAPAEERRLRRRIGEFQAATERIGRRWQHLDVTNRFAGWMSAEQYREEYFADPGFLMPCLEGELLPRLVEQLNGVLTSPEVDEQTVVALSGIGALSGLARLSHLLAQVCGQIRGRLLVFFPGEYEEGRYRLLGIDEDSNYRAVPIIG